MDARQVENARTSDDADMPAVQCDLIRRTPTVKHIGYLFDFVHESERVFGIAFRMLFDERHKTPEIGESGGDRTRDPQVKSLRLYR